MEQKRAVFFKFVELFHDQNFPQELKAKVCINFFNVLFVLLPYRERFPWVTCSCYFQSLDYSHIPTFSKMEPHLHCKLLVVMGQNPGAYQRPDTGRQGGENGGWGGKEGGGGKHLWYAGKRERQTSDAPRKRGVKSQIAFRCCTYFALTAELRAPKTIVTR